MKRNIEIFKLIICLFFCLLKLFSCQTTTKQANTEIENTITKAPPSPEVFDTSKMIKEKILVDYISTATILKPNPSNGKPFDILNYDKIIAYDFAGSEEAYPAVIDENGKFVPVVLKQQYLSQHQADKILSTLSKKSTYGAQTAACFQPHLALVFYKDNKMINQINICLGCNYLSSDIEIPAVTHKKVNKGTENEYALTGFTDTGKKAIIDLCKELNFSYGQIDENAK